MTSAPATAYATAETITTVRPSELLSVWSRKALYSMRLLLWS